jgi:hypothetical protein
VSPLTIRAFRFYFECADKEALKRINHSHWGACWWISERLKTIRAELKGPEVKGINIANVWFFEPRFRPTAVGVWERTLNALQFGVEYDVSSLDRRPARENLPSLLTIAAQAALGAPYPQLKAIGQLLSVPLSSNDLDAIQREIDVPASLRFAKPPEKGKAH